MDHLPIFLDVKDKRAVVVGGGVAAARRAETLLRAHAKVVVFASALGAEFDALAERHAFDHVARDSLESSDFAAAALCIVATDNAEADARAHRLAREAGALVNVATRPDLCDFTLPSIVDRDPVLIAVSTGGAAPLLSRRLRARLEATIPSGYGRLASLVRSAREKSRLAIPDPQRRRRFLDALLDGPIGEWAIAGETAKAEAALDEALRRAGNDEAPRGEVFLVGAGPGDPDLLTFRALRLIQKAEVVLYDHLVDPRIVDLARREAERIYVGKRRADHALAQEAISDLLVRLAGEGKRVLRLKGGDPFIFGRGGEEIEKLAEHRIPFQICPGITAAIACAAYAGIPLTHRDHAQACVFVTASSRDGQLDQDWRALVRPGQTVAVYMGLHHLEALTAAMIAEGVDPETPAAIVDNGARAHQRVVVGALGDLAGKARLAGLKGPTIIIVGSVVSLRDKFNWYEGAGGTPSQPAGGGAE